MARSHLRVYVHLVWATWDRQPLIPDALAPRLRAVIRAACEKLGCEVFAIGGMPDHVHVLVSLPATVCIADVVHDAKGASSRWLNDDAGGREPFRWQGRYGAFSVSPHERSKIVRYINHQEQHHAAGTLWPSVEVENWEFEDRVDEPAQG